jgi:hypothetical protein
MRPEQLGSQGAPMAKRSGRCAETSRHAVGSIHDPADRVNKGGNCPQEIWLGSACVAIGRNAAQASYSFTTLVDPGDGIGDTTGTGIDNAG